MSKRLSIFAGDGQLVQAAIEAAISNGWDVQLLLLSGRQDLTPWNPQQSTLSKPLSILLKLRAYGPSHICMVGSLSISDKQREGIFGFLRGKKSGRQRTTGDAGMSKLIGALEFATGAKVIGVHEILPDLRAPFGLIAGPDIDPDTLVDCSFAFNVAREIGQLDIGQAVICSGHRIIAVEDIGGTAELLARTADFVQRKMTGNGRDPLILAKAKKPNQPTTTDLPAIGPDTISQAHQAGISVICVDADNSLLIEKTQIIERANKLNISVIGLRNDDQ